MQHTAVRLTGVAVVALLAGSGLVACSATSSDDLSGTLHISNHYGNEWTTALEYAAKKFEEENPKADIVIDTVPYDGAVAALQTQFIGGSAPDIMLLEPPDITSFASRGFLEPLDDLLAEKGDSGDTWASTFTDRSLERLTAADGKNYAVPWSWIHVKVQYNATAYEELGIEAPPETGWTYDEALDTMQQITDAGKLANYDGFAGNSADLWWRLTGFLDALFRPDTADINLKTNSDDWSYDYQDPSSVAGEVYTADEKYIAFMRGITDPAKSAAYREGIEQILRMRPYLQEDLNGWNLQTQIDQFANGTLLNTDGTDSGIPSIEKTNGFEVGSTDFPTLTEENTDLLTAGGVNPLSDVRNGFVVNAASKSLPLANSFLKFITDTDVVTEMYANAGETDGTYNVQEPSAVKGVEYPAESGLTDESFTGFAQISLFGFGVPPTYDAQDTDQFNTQFYNLWTDAIDLDTFLEQRSESDKAALERNLKVYASEVDQNLINEYVQ